MVNLLPWRERGRERSRRRFFQMLAASMLLGLALLLLFDRVLDESIVARVAGNQRLRAEIGRLGERGAEAERLRREQEDAALHMQVLNSLRRSRPLPAQVLAELASQLPAGAHYRRLTRVGGEVRVEGLAQSLAAVAELTRKLSASPRFLEARLAGAADAEPEPEPEKGARGLFEFSLILRLDEDGS